MLVLTALKKHKLAEIITAEHKPERALTDLGDLGEAAQARTNVLMEQKKHNLAETMELKLERALTALGELGELAMKAQVKAKVKAKVKVKVVAAQTALKRLNLAERTELKRELV